MKKTFMVGLLVASLLATFAFSACDPGGNTQTAVFDQYLYAELEEMSVANGRTFDFTDDLCGWKVSAADQQDAEAKWVASGVKGSACVKLSGSDPAQGDSLPNSWMYNKFVLTENDKTLYINANHGNDADVNLRVRLLYFEDDKIVSAVLNSKNYEKELNEKGFYVLDHRSGSKFIYDLRAYTGKTAVISIEQDDTGDGSGETVYVNRVAIYKEYDQVSSYTEWNGALIAEDWDMRGSVIADDEGFCLKGQGSPSSLINDLKVNADAPYLKITFKDFEGGQSAAPKIEVFADGEKVTAEKEDKDYVIAPAEGFETFCYDLSPYEDQEIGLEIKISAGIVCINGILFDTSKNTLSKLSCWNKEQLAVDWDLKGNVEIHSEGVCLERYQNDSSMTNVVSISDSTNYLTISFRKFVRTTGNQDRDPKIRVDVDGVTVKAIGAADNYVTVSGDAYEKFYYDLSAKIGKNVLIEIVNIEGQHACFDTVYLGKSVSIDPLDPSEQYFVGDFEGVEESEERAFAFETDLCGWVSGTGGLEYDCVKWNASGASGLPCAQLDGSDLGSADNVLPNSWIFNKFVLSETDCMLKINFACAVDADTNVRVRLIVFEEDAFTPHVLTNETFGTTPDEHGYYLADYSTVAEYVFDISGFAGKTVIISIEQDDNGEGSGEIVFIYGIELASRF